MMNPDDIQRLQTYLQSKLGVADLEIRGRPKKGDAADVYFGEEFIGVISEDDEDDDGTYYFNMAILAIDLPE
ncbi:MAG: DUF3126 family protein [Pseudomonadota bacterium]